MTWATHHRRDTVLHDVMTAADTRRDGALLWSEVEGAEEAFDTPTDLLLAVQMRWHTRLSGAIERQLTEQPWDIPGAVVHAWRHLASEMPGVRMILDAHADDDAMRTARRKEWQLLATASGLSGFDDVAAPQRGHEVEQRARSVTVVKTAPERRKGQTVMSRVWHTVAA
ncbi:MAG: hypothetical protein ACRDOY_06115 [Nocardioidaceae bacterium]